MFHPYENYSNNSGHNSIALKTADAAVCPNPQRDDIGHRPTDIFEAQDHLQGMVSPAKTRSRISA